MTELTSLEQQVMARILAGVEQPLNTLRSQFHNSSVSRREVTGSGFFLYFQVPETEQRLTYNEPFSFGDIAARIAGLEREAGFVLHVRNGSLGFLEGFSHDEPWPDHVTGFRLRRHEGLAQRKRAVLQRVSRVDSGRQVA